MPAAKKSRVTPKKVKPEAVEVKVSVSAGLSPKQIDLIRAASGWKTSEIFGEDGEPTGRLMAGKQWLAVREVRPDLTPEDLYDCDDPAKLGIELVYQDEPDPK